MSAETCRRLEDACGKERGWMDVRHPELIDMIVTKTAGKLKPAIRSRASLVRGLAPKYLEAADKIIELLAANGIFKETLGARDELARKLARETRHTFQGKNLNKNLTARCRIQAVHPGEARFSSLP